MSARAVAGQGTRSGQRERPAEFTQAQDEAFRRGLHDFARRHKVRVSPVTKPQTGPQTQRERRAQRPHGWWHERFFAALARVGDIKGAALMIGAHPSTVKCALSRDSSLRARANGITRDYLRRQLNQLAKGQLQRLTIWPGKARQLLAMLIPVAP